MASDRLPLCPKPSGGWYSQGCTCTFHFDAFGSIERLDIVTLTVDEMKHRVTVRPQDALFKTLVSAGIVPGGSISRLVPPKVK